MFQGCKYSTVYTPEIHLHLIFENKAASSFLSHMEGKNAYLDGHSNRSKQAYVQLRVTMTKYQN